ncbi:heat shock factor-binding protein 1-like protein 1 [Varroa jacobsoni]|uniref:Heat shock factor-binding protein 1 n=1 Tax=Varroa destructor TaxID=109461 RepID=A0A7M7KH16_VARDE|nr:heat shock factor-binding protein 1-like protein 1 [Varroa destructor]XP_022702831.1 heat shock factor-binding protein 1-like protein 1 [Varroa jacobsoni]
MADPQQNTKKNSSFDKKQDGGLQNRPVEPKDLQDLTQHVQDLLQHMQDKFTVMSEQILGRIDDMSHRIEDLERNINDIVAHVGLEAAVTPTGTGPSGGNQHLSHGKDHPADGHREEKQ